MPITIDKLIGKPLLHAHTLIVDSLPTAGSQYRGIFAIVAGTQPYWDSASQSYDATQIDWDDTSTATADSMYYCRLGSDGSYEWVDISGGLWDQT